MSARIWRLGDNLHQLDTSHNRDIPTCLHVGTDGQDIKTMRGTPGPLNSGNHGNLRNMHFHHDLRHLPGGDIKTMRGTLGPLNSGNHGNLCDRHFHHDLRHLLGGEIGHNCRR